MHITCLSYQIDAHRRGIPRNTVQIDTFENAAG
jgi:hypothetical protein